MAYLAATLWVKNEASYLEEWLEFHILQGFEKFYIYDNNSTDNIKEVLAPYIKQGLVELRYYPPSILDRKNFWVMNTTIEEFKGVHKWLFHHSIDEYMFCENGQKVSDFLRNYENYAGLVVPWRLFSSNGHEKRTDDLVINRFTEYVVDSEYHIKTIIDPSKTVEHFGNPHVYWYRANQYAVYADKTIHSMNRLHHGAVNNSEHYDLNAIRINHYVVMSREEFNIKMNKGILDFTQKQENERRTSADKDWNTVHTPPFYTDRTLTKYSDIIKTNIKRRREGQRIYEINNF